MSVQNQYKAWMNCSAMPQYLLDDLRRMDEDQIYDCFYRSLSFGTGGIRSALGAGTNRMNLFTVIRVTRGLGEWLRAGFDSPSCAVSFDSRVLSDAFARTASAVLASMGIHVRIYPRLEPTPMLSFAVRYLHTSAGIMITASHNPPHYNGYKVYGPEGCQITLESESEIQAFIDRQPVLTDTLPDFYRYLDEGLIREIGEDVVEAYYHSVLKRSVKPVSCPISVVFSPLSGTGNVPVREILRRMGNIHVDVVEQQELPDGCFPFCPVPNPEDREAMDLAIRKTLETEADICFATDPDCDRMGAGVRVGNEVRLISGNDMGILMLDYICRNLHLHTGSLPPVVVKTIVTTDMASALCERYGLELRNVLTGFKFIGEQIGFLERQNQADRFLFAFEESYGYLSGTDVRDKDAVNAVLLLCEMASDLKSRGQTLLDRLSTLRKEYGVYAQRLLNYRYEGESGAGKIASVMSIMRNSPLASLPSPLSQAARTDYLHDETGLPKSDVIEFRLPERTGCVIRPSGTEAKLKAYLFVRSQTEEEADRKLDLLQGVVDFICAQ